MIASKLGEGLWSARWAAWEVLLDGQGGKWSATLSLCPEYRQMERAVVHLGKNGFTTPLDAAKWAANQLKERGQTVLLLGGSRPKTLVDMLNFEPAVS